VRASRDPIDVRSRRGAQMRGLYRGVTAPLIGGSLEAGVNYGVYYAIRRRMDSQQQPEGGLSGLDVRSLLISGMVSGGVISFVLAPTELLKVRLVVTQWGVWTRHAHAPPLARGRARRGRVRCPGGCGARPS
jgi:hypothetical protein